MLKNVKVYENGGRAATTTFVQRGIGDVLVTFENEANLAATDFGAGQVDIVYPNYYWSAYVIKDIVRMTMSFMGFL